MLLEVAEIALGKQIAFGCFIAFLIIGSWIAVLYFDEDRAEEVNREASEQDRDREDVATFV